METGLDVATSDEVWAALGHEGVPLGGVFTLGAAIIKLRAAIINARKGAPPPPPPVPSESRPPRATGAPPTKAG